MGIIAGYRVYIAIFVSELVPPPLAGGFMGAKSPLCVPLLVLTLTLSRATPTHQHQGALGKEFKGEMAHYFLTG